MNTMKDKYSSSELALTQSYKREDLVLCATIIQTHDLHSGLLIKDIDITQPDLFKATDWPAAGRCGCCNARLVYSNFILHKPSGRGVLVGNDCCRTHWSFHRSESELKALRMGALKLAKSHATISRLNRLLPAFTWALDEADYSVGRKAGLAHEIAVKVAGGRTLSFKQWRLIARLHRQHFEDVDKKAQWEAQREAERAAAPPIHTGRQVIEGEVLAIKESFTQWGASWRMTVKQAGNVYNGTCPSSILDDVEVGDEVSFTASKVTVSDRDDHFAFFSRPTKASIICKNN